MTTQSLSFPLTCAGLPKRQLIVLARVTDQELAVRTERQRSHRIRVCRYHLTLVVPQIVDGQVTIAGAHRYPATAEAMRDLVELADGRTHLLQWFILQIRRVHAVQSNVHHLHQQVRNIRLHLINQHLDALQDLLLGPIEHSLVQWCAQRLCVLLQGIEASHLPSHCCDKRSRP